MAVLRSAALATLLVACGTGEGEGGGSTALPTLGGGPFGKLQDPRSETPIREPVLVAGGAASLTDPAVLPGADGAFRIWFTRDDVEIATTRVPALGEIAEPITVAVTATEDWEQGAVRQPTVYVDGDGTLVMLYGTAAARIGRARSSDGGVTWTKDTAPVLDDAEHPGAGGYGPYVLLYFTRPGERDIYLAESHDEGDFIPWGTPVLQPTGGADAFDSDRLVDPQPVVRITATGDLHVGLYYAGSTLATADLYALGYAASRDGVSFEKLPANPILDPGLPSERGPAALVETTRALLLFSQPSGMLQVIAGATHP